MTFLGDLEGFVDYGQKDVGNSRKRDLSGVEDNFLECLLFFEYFANLFADDHRHTVLREIDVLQPDLVCADLTHDVEKLLFTQLRVRQLKHTKILPILDS